MNDCINGPGSLWLAGMVTEETLRAASGWLELGLGDEALREIRGLSPQAQARQEVLEMRLRAEMDCKTWNPAADTARLLCLKQPHEPEFFIHAAFCLHETGDTLAACQWLLRGPKTLMEMGIFHYNLACYYCVLGDEINARSHLKQACDMDESFRATALNDNDLSGLGILKNFCK